MKVALVHDYLNEFGGAERVLLALSETYPKASIYTAFYREGSTAHKRFKNRKIITSWAQNVPFFASKLHSPLRFLAPLIWGSFDFSKFDVVITSASWYVTKGFKRNQKPVEICYCHTPPRYLYGYPTASGLQKYFLVRVYALLVNHFMRVYDFEAAQRVDWFIANSKEVQGRIKKFYRRESVVIYPPVDVEKFSGPVSRFPPVYGEAVQGEPVSARSGNKSIGDQEKTVELRAVGDPSSTATRKSSEGYFLAVSRLVGAKNVDVAVEVCKNLKLLLKVVGTGREMRALKELASSQSNLPSSGQAVNSEQSTIDFLGDVSDDALVKLYQDCRALIFPASQEDFGIVPVEAMAAGKPVIALAEGGVKETVIDGKTGLLVEDLTPGAFVIAINRFMKMEKEGEWDSKFIQKHAQKFSKERFKREIKKFVESKFKKA